MRQLPHRHRLATDLEDLPEQGRIGRGAGGERHHVVHRDEGQPPFPTAEDERPARPAGGVLEHLLPGLDERPRPDDAPGHAAGPELLLGRELGPEQVGGRVSGRPDDRHQDHRCPGRPRCREEVGIALPGRPRPVPHRDRRGTRGTRRSRWWRPAAPRRVRRGGVRRPPRSAACRPGPLRLGARSRVSTRTSWPCAISAATSRLPSNPLPPATTITRITSARSRGSRSRGWGSPPPPAARSRAPGSRTTALPAVSP